MHEQYVASGGRAELIEFGSFGSDAHGMFGSRAGEAIWQPVVEKFMRQIGLPTEVVFPEYAPAKKMPMPPVSQFAKLDAVEQVPYLSPKGRDGYEAFLSKPKPRAFALSVTGAWSWATLGEDPLRQALENCNKRSKTLCRLYAVDDQVVWSEP
jgi:hypothetical protein